MSSADFPENKTDDFGKVRDFWCLMDTKPIFLPDMTLWVHDLGSNNHYYSLEFLYLLVKRYWPYKQGSDLTKEVSHFYNSGKLKCVYFIIIQILPFI